MIDKTNGHQQVSDKGQPEVGEENSKPLPSGGCRKSPIRNAKKAVRCEFALHAMAYNLSRAVALWARAVLSLSQSLQKIRRMGKGPKGRAHHHTAES